MEKAEQKATEAMDTAGAVSDTLVGALSAVELTLGETRVALERAVHKAKEAQSVIGLLKHQVRSLKRQLEIARSDMH